MLLRQALSLATSLAVATAQFPPKPENVTVLQSKHHSGITISYKEPGICETTPGVKSYAGYVHLPPDALNEPSEHNAYPINTFYWFFESRKDPANAPLSIWLNGGPGGSSLLGLLQENGPCFVANDSKSTYLNPWSWNNEVNMLFIDQPNQVGYSYDTLTNVTVNLKAEENEEAITPADFSNGVPEQNNTFLVGTYPSGIVNQTANSTQHAAAALWHFAQTWFEEFPQYKPNDESISLFTESFGGHYGPGIMEYWLRQNELIANGTINTPGTHYLHLNTLGVINGCINAPQMFKALIDFPHKNTYGIEAITQEQYEWSTKEFERSGGVLDAINDCRELQDTTDPHDHGDVAHTNEVCSEALERAENITDYLFVKNNNAARFDITHELKDPFPPSYFVGWLNNAETQSALGVPVNHSWVSNAVPRAFDKTGDLIRGGQLAQLARLLDHGIRVTLFHGDRDYACNWLGGEQTALSIPWKHQDEFVHQTGYQPISLGYPYTQSAGHVRQFGNLSFARVFQAGHMVPSYQPEAAYEIFMRAVRGLDIATGSIDLKRFAHENDQADTASARQYASHGLNSSWHILSDVLPQPPHECYVLDPGSSCTEEEQGWIADGSAIVKDFILIGKHEKGDKKDNSHEYDLHGFAEAQKPMGPTDL